LILINFLHTLYILNLIADPIYMMNNIFFIITLVGLFMGDSIAQANGLNYYGRIFHDGQPIESETAELTIQITGNNPNCVIYEEIHSNVLIKDGLINEVIGKIGANSTLTYSSPGLMTIESVFKNIYSFECQAGGNYNPLTNPERNIVVFFRESPVHNPIKLDPQPIKAGPLAVTSYDAEKLGGKDPSNYLQETPFTTQDKLDDLLNKSTDLISIVSNINAGLVLPKSNTTSGSAGMIRYNNTNSLVEFNNGAMWIGFDVVTNTLPMASSGSVTGGLISNTEYNNILFKNQGGTINGGLALINPSNLTFYDVSSGSNNNYIQLKGPSGMASNYSITLPPSAPQAGDVLSASSVSAGSTGSTVTLSWTSKGTIDLIGTANQVNVAVLGNTYTLSTPQNLHTGATPNFAGLLLSGALNVNANVTVGSGENPRII
jgi:hypothetical protein